MYVNPYLVFSGDCEVAFKLYEQLLGGKIEVMMRHEGSPMANPRARKAGALRSCTSACWWAIRA